MARVPLVGGFYEDSSIQFNAQRSVNMYPEISEDGGKGQMKLQGTPGLSFFTRASDETLIDEKILGMHLTADDRLFTVWHSDESFMYVSEILEDGSIIKSAPISAFPRPDYASIADNGIVLSIVAGNYKYFYNLSTGLLKTITDPDMPSVVTDVVFKDTYFVWLAPEEGRFYISSSYASNEADCVDGLEFGTVESSPDDLVGIVARTNEILIFGTKTIEPYYNNANVDFPWARNNGGIQDVGTLSRLSIATINNDIFFLGSNKDGFGIVYVLKGYSLVRISTSAIESKLRDTTDLSGVVAYTYQEDGGYFYVMNVPGLDTTLCYDSGSGKWHERAILEDDGTYSKLPGVFSVFAWGKNFVSESIPVVEEITGRVQEKATILQYDKNARDVVLYDDGNGYVVRKTMPRERTIQHIYNENKNIKITQLELDIQKGVGLVDNVEPTIELAMSLDGGITFGEPVSLPMGKIGEYRRRCILQRLGIGRDIVFKFYSTSPVQHEWLGINMEVKALND